VLTHDLVQSAGVKRAKLQLVGPASVAFNPALRSGTSSSAGRKQVAAVCYRVLDNEIDFLLVRTRKGRWIFPKGGVEVGLTHAESAALEAMEEAGAHGRIEDSPFTSYKLKKKLQQDSPPVKAYLFAVVRTEPAPEAYRTPTWFSEGKVKQRLRESRSHEDGEEFTRVIDAAMARVRGLQNGNMPTRDVLQRVQFESSASSLETEARTLIRSLKTGRAGSTLRLPGKANRAKVLQLGRGSFQR
jgi:8-oxo-dGTP pyrophosphatase MutT (NUDIX family)